MDVLQAIAEPRRREILHLVWNKELSAGEIAARFDVSWAAVSQHLNVLRDTGLVSVRPQGRHRYYRADHNEIGPLRGLLEDMWEGSLDKLASLVEEEKS
jgi:DNA-binding transcriptional ArsR family regulator